MSSMLVSVMLISAERPLPCSNDHGKNPTKIDFINNEPMAFFKRAISLTYTPRQTQTTQLVKGEEQSVASGNLLNRSKCRSVSRVVGDLNAHGKRNDYVTSTTERRSAERGTEGAHLTAFTLAVVSRWSLSPQLS